MLSGEYSLLFAGNTKLSIFLLQRFERAEKLQQRCLPKQHPRSPGLAAELQLDLQMYRQSSLFSLIEQLDSKLCEDPLDTQEAEDPEKELPP